NVSRLCIAALARRLWSAISLSIAISQPIVYADDSGLVVTYKSVTGGAADLEVAPNISLFVPAGRAASPFIPAGAFEATWEGNVSAELRSEFSFQAELNGQLKLEINGLTVYEASANGG